VVSDLDGCLLDAKTYAYDDARPALAGLTAAGWPLVLCSGKTRAEMEPLARQLELCHPFIVENGGGIVFPPGSFEGDVPGAPEVDGVRLLDLGPPRASLVRALEEIAREAGVKVRGFADLLPIDVQALTGLSEPAAHLAMDRHYDEPFVVEDDAASDGLARAAKSRGLVITHGGRFHHLMGGSDKGLAVRTLLALYERAGRSYEAVGLGDAETDLSLLRAVSRPIVVPHPDGNVDPALAASLPEAERAPHPGPAGWNAAILAVIEGRTLPRLREAAAGAVP
jgi:mannosyl-3-phosphoglycerate phosphatase family protein